MSIKSDFGGKSLYVGTLRGVRGWSWRFELQGVTLMGIALPYRWKSTMQAECRPILAMKLDKQLLNTHQCQYSHPGDPKPVPSKDCFCGIYAYFSADEPNQFAQDWDFTGIIESWGRVICGDKGFRAEHARIVALVLPVHLPAWVPGEKPYKYGPFKWSILNRRRQRRVRNWMISSVQENYPDVPIYPTMEEALRDFPVEGLVGDRELGNVPL